MMCLGVGLFASILPGTLCASWTCMSISLTKLGKFSFIIVSIRFPIFLLFLFSWHSYDTNVGILEVVPEAPYTILGLGGSFFFLLFCLFFASLCSKSFIGFLVSSTLLLFPSKLFISTSVSYISAWIFFMLWRSSLRSLSILITSVLRSISDRLLITILFSSFSGVLICYFIWAMFVSSLRQPFCVCFYTLGSAAMTPRLGSMA